MDTLLTLLKDDYLLDAEYLDDRVDGDRIQQRMKITTPALLFENDHTTIMTFEIVYGYQDSEVLVSSESIAHSIFQTVAQQLPEYATHFPQMMMAHKLGAIVLDEMKKSDALREAVSLAICRGVHPILKEKYIRQVWGLAFGNKGGVVSLERPSTLYTARKFDPLFWDYLRLKLKQNAEGLVGGSASGTITLS